MSLIEITLPVSGVTVKIRRQRAMVMERFVASIEQDLQGDKPTPPLISVEVSPGEYKDIPNESDEEYLVAARAHMIKTRDAADEKLLHFIAKTCMEFDVDYEEVTTLRQAYCELGMKVEDDDKIFYAKYVLAASNEDYHTLIYEVFGRSLPREAQVAMHSKLFPR